MAKKHNLSDAEVASLEADSERIHVSNNPQPQPPQPQCPGNVVTCGTCKGTGKDRYVQCEVCEGVGSVLLK